MKTIHGFTLAILLLAGAGQAVSAAESDEWRFQVTPYLMMAGLDGTLGIRGVTAEVDASFSDILDDLEMGFMGIVSAQKGPWTFAGEAIYFDLESVGAKSVTGPFGNVTVNGALEVDTDMYVYALTAGYRVHDGKAKVDLVATTRYTKVAVDSTVQIATTPGIVFPGGALSAKGSQSWVDFAVGAHALYPVSEEVSLLGYVDAGAGGSDFTWQFIGGLTWDFHEGYAAQVGYRYFDWDYEDGGFVWDMAASGPYVGLTFKF